MITGIIMASGFSARLNRDKLLLDIGGMPLIEHIILAAKKSCLDEVVLAYRKEKIKNLAKKNHIKAVFNGNAHEGQSAAIKAGIMAADTNTNAYMFIAGDQPMLTAETIARLVKEFLQNPLSIIVPDYAGQRGTPVIFPSSLQNELIKLTGDCGGRTIIEARADQVKTVPFLDKNAGLDIDIPEDYEQARKLLGLH
jgi:molybdenum cofactor cytidylyltransferase